MKKIVSLIVLLLLSMYVYSAEQFKIYSTSLIKKHPSRLQVGVIEVKDTKLNSIDVCIALPDFKIEKHFDNLVASNHKVVFEFPVLDKAVSANVLIVSDGEQLYNEVVAFNPPKKWTIYDVQVSHHDLGYADYYHMMRRDVREMGIEMALEFARKTDSWPKESQFHWTVETSEPMIRYLHRQPKAVVTELVERINKGQISLGGIHNSVSTEHMGFESMARLFYTPNRYICDWLGIAPSKTALNDDVVGFSRSLATYSKEADIPYFMFGRNSSVKEFDTAEDYAAFYWMSPDKDSKMTLFKSWHYYSPDRLIKYDWDEISSLCKRYEDNVNYPYSCLLAEDSYDFGMPDFANVEGIRNWNADYENPVLVSATFDMYFDDLNSQQDKGSFPVYVEDIPNAWADEDASDVEFSNWAHKLHSEIPTMEKWATITSALSGKPFPWIDVFQAYNGLLSWAEHTNGVYSEGAIFVPHSLTDTTAANVVYYEIEQEMHRDLIRESQEAKLKAEEKIMPAFDRLLTTASKFSVVVSNPLTCLRSDFVSFNLPDGMIVDKIIDNVSGEDIDFQYKDRHSVLFFSENVPSMGYKTYSLVLKKGIVPDIQYQHAEIPRLETDFYRVEFDKKTGSIASLYDKGLQRELVDQQAKFKLNEYYYLLFKGDSYQDGKNEYHPVDATFDVIKGSIADIVVAHVKAEGADEIVQKAIFYKNSNRIDFEITFDKKSSGRSIDDYRNYSPNGKEALFYCLPFNIPDFKIHHDLTAGVVEPIEDQLKGSTTNYYAFQSFSDISNDDWGITLATVEPNLVEYGHPRAAYWAKGEDYESIMKKADKSHFYLYLLNNMFFTNVRIDQPGPKSFNWSIKPHAGNWQKGESYMFGRYISNPLQAYISKGKRQGLLPLDQFSFVEVDQKGVFCTTIKPAEANGEGYILRFVDVEGKSCPVRVDVNFINKISKANFTNLVEVDCNNELAIKNDNSFSFYMPAFGVKTIRVIPESVSDGKVVSVQAKALSDRKIYLKWNVEKKNDNIAYYNIYRATERDFTPDISSYVATVDDTEYLDAPCLRTMGWKSNIINPSTTYYYKIIPVNKYNKPGVCSDVISVCTLSDSVVDDLPHKVQGLNATRISSISGHNYVALYFYTNIENDVVKYEIYRGKNSSFTLDEASKIGEVDVNEKIDHTTPHGFARVVRKLGDYCSQLYIDQDVEAFTTYYYCVVPVDNKGRRGESSDFVSVKTKVASLQIEGNISFIGQTDVKVKNPNIEDYQIRYTTDGKIPTVSSTPYTGPVKISSDVLFTAGLFDDSGKLLGVTSKLFKVMKDYHVTYNTPYSSKWPGAGDITLIDGQRGGLTLGSLWQGFEVADLDIVVDMKSLQDIHSVSLGCLQNTGTFVFLPTYVEVQVSDDGVNYTKVGRIDAVREWQRLDSKKVDMNVSFASKKCRYVRIFAKNIEKNPEWHPFAGSKSWLFVDEVIIE